MSVGCLLPHAAYATPLQDDLIAIRTAMQAELASDRDYGEINRQAKTFEERLAILCLQQAEAESIVRHLRQIKMHSKEGRTIRDKMAGSFEKISNIMTVGITVKPEDIPAFSTMAENMKTASRETLPLCANTPNSRKNTVSQTTNDAADKNRPSENPISGFRRPSLS